MCLFSPIFANLKESDVSFFLQHDMVTFFNHGQIIHFRDVTDEFAVQTDFARELVLQSFGNEYELKPVCAEYKTRSSKGKIHGHTRSCANRHELKINELKRLRQT